MCEDCEDEYEDGSYNSLLLALANKLKHDITFQLEYLALKLYYEPKRNRMLMKIFGTLEPTLEQILDNLPRDINLVPTYIDSTMVDMVNALTPLVELIPRVGEE